MLSIKGLGIPLGQAIVQSELPASTNIVPKMDINCSTTGIQKAATFRYGFLSFNLVQVYFGNSPSF